jgi:hypothetical protein
VIRRHGGEGLARLRADQERRRFYRFQRPEGF